MKLIESVKSVPEKIGAIPKSTVITILKPVLSLVAGIILAGSEVLGEESVLCAAVVAAMPPVCGFSAVLGAALFTAFTEITVGKVASLATATVVFLMRLLFEGTSRRRYPMIVSIVSAVSYLGCAVFAGVSTSFSVAESVRAFFAGAVLCASTYLMTTVFRSDIRSSLTSASKAQLLALSALTVTVASAYHIGQFSIGEALCLLISTVCIHKLNREKATLAAVVLSAGLCIGTSSAGAFALILPLMAALFPTRLRISGKRAFTAGYVFLVTLILTLIFPGGLIARVFELIIAEAIFMALPESVFSLAASDESQDNSLCVASLRLSFISYATGKLSLSKPENASEDESAAQENSERHRLRERSFETMTELLSLTECELSDEMLPEAGNPLCDLICEILSGKCGVKVTGNPLPDGAIELYFPKNARISENAVISAAGKAGMGSGVELFRSETGSHIRFIVTPKPKWHFDAGICQMAADFNEIDEGISGDCAEVWNFGVYSHLILSDGMGTGIDARRTAKSLIVAFRSLSEAGYSPESALRLSSEYIRSCQTEESFATLDVLSANLMTGDVTIRKCGSAKSYVISNEGITPIPSGGYPLGIIEEMSLTNTHIPPEKSLMIVMMTDGADGLGIEKIAEIVQGSEKLSTDDIAAVLTSEARKSQRADCLDDITVAVVRLSEN